MIVKRTLILVFVLTALLWSVPTSVLAHPGNTAADGCHYCRTNCDRWGVSWGERHCHGGTAPPPPPRFIFPTSTPRPTLTPKPTKKPQKKKAKPKKKKIKKTKTKKSTSR